MRNILSAIELELSRTCAEIATAEAFRYFHCTIRLLNCTTFAFTTHQVPICANATQRAAPAAIVPTLCERQAQMRRICQRQMVLHRRISDCVKEFRWTTSHQKATEVEKQNRFIGSEYIQVTKYCMRSSAWFEALRLQLFQFGLHVH